MAFLVTIARTPGLLLGTVSGRGRGVRATLRADGIGMKRHLYRTAAFALLRDVGRTRFDALEDRMGMDGVLRPLGKESKI